jgi:pSer/pThr/pTyr-binding forkhead associated (FHA) protein
MATLILSMDGLVLKEISLDKDRITIGRKSHNDVQIDNPAISGEHAAIVTILDDSFLEDLDSTNGTLVNGRRVEKHALRHNDVIEMGKYRLKYLNPPAVDDEDDKIPVSPEDAGIFLDPSEKIPSPYDDKPALLRVLNGAMAGHELSLTKDETTLGRPGVQIAKIVYQPGGYFISRVEGDSPLVNDQPVGPQGRLLKAQDKIEVMGVKMALIFP